MRRPPLFQDPAPEASGHLAHWLPLDLMGPQDGQHLSTEAAHLLQDYLVGHGPEVHVGQQIVRARRFRPQTLPCTMRPARL